LVIRPFHVKLINNSLDGRNDAYVEHFKKFYCDTAVFGFAPKILDIVVDFFGPDRVLFRSNSPMDVTGGQYFTSVTLRSIDAMSISPELRRAILAKNASRVLKIA
jgi:predicted TIM-barrel fold metal-dependent hydrolase